MPNTENVTFVNQARIDDWLRTLNTEQKLYLSSRYNAGRADGLALGTKEARTAIKISKFLIPAIMVSVAVGIAAQRLLGLV